MINRSIETSAASLLGRHGIVRQPIPVEDIAKREGIQVIRSAAEPSESGFLLRDHGQVVIGLNSRNTRRRQRFTIAHELGHFLLHDGRAIIIDHAVRINKRDSVSSAATDDEEIQANAFAAALLMPDLLVRQAVERELQVGRPTRDELTAQLAHEFDVSQEAMNIRMINLGIYTA